MTGKSISIRTVSWTEAEAEIRRVRETVFMHEQNVPEELEWDGLDADCIHVLACSESGEAVGTGRLTPEGRIGRMAVMRNWRNRGVGDLLLLALLKEARRRGHPRIVLAAQTPVIGFYERHGFRAFGEIFEDAGIPHREMYLDLARDAG